MSNEALTWAFKQDLPTVQKFVLVALADYADEAGTCFPSHRKTAERIGASRSTVRRAITELTNKGYLTYVREHRADGTYKANRYSLKVGAVIGNTDPKGWVHSEPIVAQSEPRCAAQVNHSGVTVGQGCAAQVNQHEPPENPHIPPIETGAAVATVKCRPEIEQLCELMADRIEANGSKRPTITKRWEDACRLMLDRDGRTPEQIAYLINWSQSDSFWKSNILSMPKLRDKFDQLRLQATSRIGQSKSDQRAENILRMVQDMEGGTSGHAGYRGGSGVHQSA